MRKTVKFLNTTELKEWAEGHPWKEEKENGRKEIARRSRKNK